MDMKTMDVNTLDVPLTWELHQAEKQSDWKKKSCHAQNSLWSDGTEADAKIYTSTFNTST